MSTKLTKEQRLASLRRQIEEISALLEEQKKQQNQNGTGTDTRTIRILSEDLKELRKQIDELELNR